MMKLNKRGNISDIPYLIVFIFVMALVGFLMLFVVQAFSNANITYGSSGNTTIVNQTMASGLAFFEGYDSLIMWAAVLLALALMVSAYFVRTHPILFFGGGIIIVVISIILGTGFGDVFLGLTGNSAFDSVRGNFGITTYIFTYFPYIVLFLVGLTVIALYAKGVLGGNA